MNAGKCFVSALLLAALSGCSSGPISRDLREQAQQVTFNQVKADPDGTRGTVVIWGGRIIGVANNTNGGSIYILGLPVRGGGKPRSGQPSPGRFMAVSPGFIDPELFPQGMRITVAGPLDGVWTESLEDVQYTYPVVQFQQVHLWPESQPRPSPNVSVSMGPAWNPYWGPGWGPSPWGWYGYSMYRPGFRGSFYAGVRVGPGPGRRSGGRPAPPPARRRR
ncbi:MAG TPA: Slp family lipoprotein [Alphaproteobacteria bacterium]|nr:Slp family lipoprotein [Alphaproteobacteria bacterium]